MLIEIKDEQIKLTEITTHGLAAVGALGWLVPTMLTNQKAVEMLKQVTGMRDKRQEEGQNYLGELVQEI